jgi:hypothetical protein
LFHPESLEESKMVYNLIINDPNVDGIHIGVHYMLPNKGYISIDGQYNVHICKYYTLLRDILIKKMQARAIFTQIGHQMNRIIMLKKLH